MHALVNLPDFKPNICGEPVGKAYLIPYSKYTFLFKL